MSETKHRPHIWLDEGKPNCDGEPVIEDREDGHRHITCPKCSLHWYITLGASV